MGEKKKVLREKRKRVGKKEKERKTGKRQKKKKERKKERKRKTGKRQKKKEGGHFLQNEDYLAFNSFVSLRSNSYLKRRKSESNMLMRSLSLHIRKVFLACLPMQQLIRRINKVDIFREARKSNTAKVPPSYHSNVKERERDAEKEERVWRM